MERKKLPSDIQLEDLLNAVNDESDKSLVVDDTVFKSDVLSFLLKNNLKTGSHPVKGQALYRVYKLQSKDPIDATNFGIQIGLYILKENDYYFINKEPSELIADYSLAIKEKRSPRIRSRSTKVHFTSFLNTYKIEAGEEWIEDHIITYFYDRWIYEKSKNKKLKNSDIISLMRACFEHKNTKHGYVFKLKHGFPGESVENLREAWKRKKQKGQK